MITTISRYKPLLVSISLSFVAGLALSGSIPFMTAWMGVFLLFLSFLKLVDVGAYSRALARYDPFVNLWAGWGYGYPFLEGALAIWLLSGWEAPLAGAGVCAVFAYNAVVVDRALSKGITMSCPCLGTTLDAPLSRVTFWENTLMALMGLSMALP